MVVVLKCWNILILGVVLSLGFSGTAFSEITYPYTLESGMTASIDVYTSTRTPLGHMLLSVNDSGHSYYRYNSDESKTQFRAYQPLSVRWPTGLWANFYDWEVDGRRIYDGYTGTYYDWVVDNPGFRYGFPGFHELHDELGFDVLWSWNVNYDSVEKGVRRLRDRKAKGFDFEWIELGNESYFLDQRSELIATPELYVNVARAHSQALKAEESNVLISVPVTWRTYNDATEWNNALRADMSYYDAVSVHKYVRPGPSLEGAREVLKAGQTMYQTALDINAMYPDKPIWLSEWSVDCGDNALSVLGMADVYLCFFNHTDIFEMSQYHQASGDMEPFFTYDSSSDTLTKTSYGAAYEVIRSVFEKSELFNSAVNSSEISSGLKGVLAEAVLKDGQVMIFALNKTTTDVPFTVRFNGLGTCDLMDHKALTFSDVNAFNLYQLQEDVLETVALQVDDIVLPPLSLNVITGFKSLPVTFGNNGQPWAVGTESTVRIEAENYNVGGEGVGYHDTTAGNTPSVYRTDDVDIGATTDVNGGYTVGYIAAEEWLDYTVDIAKRGIYNLTFRTARDPAGDTVVCVLFDGQDKTGRVAVPSTGDWSDYVDVQTTVALAAGQQVMRVAFIESLMNLNWIELSYVGPNPDFVTPSRVDLGDFAVFAQNWMRQDCSPLFNVSCDGADLDGSGVVEITDLQILANQWLTNPLDL